MSKYNPISLNIRKGWSAGSQAAACAIAAACVLAFSACPADPPPSSPIVSSIRTQIQQRHNEGTWYEIFSGSFADSNNDGIGDFKGITAKLDYLNDTGTKKHDVALGEDNDDDGFPDEVCNNSLHVNGIWLTPIMPSPSYHKYDTKDYRNVDPQFGTMADFRELLEECHKRGIKLIIDLVMNHTSDQHPWFQKAVAEIKSGTPGRYASYYNFWYDSSPPEYESKDFGYSTSENKWYVANRYYKHWGRVNDDNGVTLAWFEGGFWTGMPDLNWDSKALREEFDDVIAFWLDMGLDGFRLDATSHVYYNPMFGQYSRNNPGFNTHEKNIELWTWFADTCRKHNSNVYLVGECWEDESVILNYYNTGMNFFCFPVAFGTVGWALQGNGPGWATTMQYWKRAIETRNTNGSLALFLSNHDQGRSYYTYQGAGGAEYGNGAKMAASLYLMSPGTPFIYYGEEIGMVNFVSPDKYYHFSPDNESYVYPGSVHEDSDERGPMWWSSFDTLYNPEPPEHQDWYGQEVPPKGSVEEQLANSDSLLRHYIKVINLKNKYPWIAWGALETIGTEGNLSAFRVTDDDKNSETYGKSIVALHNVSYWEQIDKLAVEYFLPYGYEEERNYGFSARYSDRFPQIYADPDDSNKEKIYLPEFGTMIIQERGNRYE